MIFISMVAPKTTSGMLITRPSTKSTMLPFATAATAMTLSRLITRSAIRMVLIAPSRCELDLTPSPSPSSGTSSFTAIQNRSAPPTSLRKESFSNSTATMVSTIRSTTAAPAPQMIACFCWCAGSERAASAITTALSPDRMMLTQMIAPSPSQNCDVRSSSIQRSPLVGLARRRSEQSDDLAVDQVDLDRGRHFGKPGHRHDIPADHHHELGPCRQPHLAHVDDVVRGRGPQLRLGREGVLGFRHAHRIVPVAVVLELLDLPPNLPVGGHLARAIDLLRDLVDLVPERVLVLVHELEIALALAQIDHDARQFRRALAAVAPMSGEHDLGA